MSRRASTMRRGLPPALAGMAAPSDKRFRRSEQRQAGRGRFGPAAWRAGRGLLAGGLVAAAVGWLASLALDASFLRITRVVVSGNMRLSTGEVEAMLGGLRGEHILRVELEPYRQRVLDSPWVATASLWRVLPSTVEVRIAERAPMAIARLGQQLYLVDDTGAVIDEFGPQYHEFDLPIVDGLIATPSSGAPSVDPARVRLTGRLLEALESRADLRERISQIDVSNAHDVAVLLDDDPAWLHVGETRFVERLQSYLELGPTLRDQVAGIDYVDLRFDERIYVRGNQGKGRLGMGNR